MTRRARAEPRQGQFDLAIVGGGPAGSACALAASRAGLSVALFEAQRVLCDKPCGEGLMPPGLDALHELGLDGVVAAGRTFDRLRYVVPGREALELALPRPGLTVDRPSLMQGFEGALSRARGVTRFLGHVEVARLRPDGRTRGFRVASKSFTVEARALAVADGLNGKTAPWLRAGEGADGRDRPVRRAARLGVRARYRARGALDAVEIHFSKGTEVYLTPLRGGRINVAVLVSGEWPHAGGCEAILARALSEHARAMDRLGARVTAPEARILGHRLPARIADEGALLVGDAGGGVDPILGCGVTLALESGILAARACAALVQGDDSGVPERGYVREYQKRTQLRRALAAVLLGLSNRPFLARSAVGLARLAPGLLGSLVGVAAGGREPASVG